VRIDAVKAHFTIQTDAADAFFHVYAKSFVRQKDEEGGPGEADVVA